MSADDIASKLIGLLVEGFVAKKGRAPNEAEIEQLLGELTEERVLALMSGATTAASTSSSSSSTTETASTPAAAAAAVGDQSLDSRLPAAGAAYRPL